MGRSDDFITLVKEGDLTTLSRLVQKIISSSKTKSGVSKKFNINQVDSKGLSALHHAVLQNNVEALKLLVQAGASVDIIDEKGVRPLHLAASADKVKVVELLLNSKSKVNEPTFDGNTPLHIAAEHGHLDTVNLLLSHKADPTIHNFNHKTALDLACEFGSDRVVERLIESKLCEAQLTGVLQLSEAETRRSTCLHLASRNGQVAVIRQLMQAGFDMNSCSMNGTALHEAVAYNKPDVVTLLLELGVDAGMLNLQRLTAYELTKQCATLLGHEKLCQRLKDLSKRPVIVRALRSYTAAQNSDHLSFTEGQLITVTERQVGGMWKGFVCGGGGSLHPHHSDQTPRPFHPSDVERVLNSRQGSSSPFPDWSSRPYDVTPGGRVVYPSNGNQGDCRHVSHDASPYSVTVGMDQAFPLPPKVIEKSRTFASDSSGDSGIDLRLTSSPQNSSPIQPNSSSGFPGRPHADWSHNGSAEEAASLATAQQLNTRHHNHHHHHRSASPMFNKANSSPTGSNRSSTASSSGSGSSSSGYLGSSGQVNNNNNTHNGVGGIVPHIVTGAQAPPPHLGGSSHRLHDSSSLSNSASRFSYTSHGSLEDQSLVDSQLVYSPSRGPPHSPGFNSGAAQVAALYQQGKYQDSEALHYWLVELKMPSYYQNFIQSGYDMPTISRMTPEDLTAIGITNPSDRKKLTYEISRMGIGDGIPNYRPIPDCMIERVKVNCILTFSLTEASVLEWLQLLKLEQYYEVLMRDGYKTFNHITDIAWEDLEDIGFRKLGHQKKIILAIDKLKKLGSRRVSDQLLDDSVRSSSNHNMSYNHVSHPNRIERPPQTTVTPGRISKSESGDNINALMRSSVKPVEVTTGSLSQICGESGRRPSSAQPEVVAIQLRRDPLPRAMSSSNDDLGSVDQQITYESFHGDPSNDFSLLVNEFDQGRPGDMTPTNEINSLSIQEMDATSFGKTLKSRLNENTQEVYPVSPPVTRPKPQVAPRPDVRARRASGDSARPAECASPTATITSGYATLKRRVSCRETTSTFSDRLGAAADVQTSKVSCRVTPLSYQPEGVKVGAPLSYQSEAGGAKGALKVQEGPPSSPGGSTVMSARSEDLEGRNAQTCASKCKKAPPPPPKRTNSVKEETRNPTTSDVLNTPELIFTSASNASDGLIFNAEDQNSLDKVIERLQWSGDQSIRPAKHRGRLLHSSSPTPAPVTSLAGLELREGSATLGRAPSGSTSLNRSDSNCSSCSGDSNTLPFANENVGTIRQKFAAAAAENETIGGGRGNTAERNDMFGVRGNTAAFSSTVQDTRGVGIKKPVKPVPAQKPLVNKQQPSSPSTTLGNGLSEDVFSDIDSMLHGLTQELDDMLISKD